MQWQTEDPAARELLDAALAARGQAHAPYSKFAVGAALRLPDRVIVTGCNVENASYGLTVCAERVAVQRAVAEGRLHSGTHIAAIAVIGELSQPLTPCGACRQVLAEFAGPGCAVYCANTAGLVAHFTLGELLPAAFGLQENRSS